MKIIKKFFTLLIVSFVLLGCSNAGTSSNEPLADEDFVLNVSRGLEARWAYTDKEDTALMSTSELQDAYKKYIDAEKMALGKITDYEIKDEELVKIAETYYKGLELQEDGIQYAGTDDYANQLKTWDLGMNYRICAIHDLVEDFGLTVSSKYQSNIDDFMAQYKTAKKDVTVQEYVNTLPEKVTYTKNEELSNEYSTIYTAIIENTTDVTIDSLQINADFLDANGVSIYQSVDYRNNLAPGAKVQSELYYEVEKGEVASINLTFDAYCE